MKQRLARAGGILVMIAGSFLSVRALYAHPDLKSVKIVVRKVLIVPPRATVTKSGMKGNETLIAESGIVEGALPAVVAEAVQGKGCTVLGNVFAPEPLEKNQDLKF